MPLKQLEQHELREKIRRKIAGRKAMDFIEVWDDRSVRGRCNQIFGGLVQRPLGYSEDLLDHPLGIRELMILKVGRVNGRGVKGANPLNWCVKGVKGVFLNQGRHHSGYAAEGLRLIHTYRPIGFHDRFEDAFLVKGSNGAQIEYFRRNIVLLLQDFRRFECSEDRSAVGDEGNI